MCPPFCEDGWPPSACVAALDGRFLFVAQLTVCLPAVTNGRWLVSWLLGPLLHTPSLFGWSRLFITVPSLLPGVALNHPHLSCNPPAIELWECRRSAPTTRAVCYHVSYREST
jgi:hypothetical protein